MNLHQAFKTMIQSYLDNNQVAEAMCIIDMADLDGPGIGDSWHDYLEDGPNALVKPAIQKWLDSILLTES